MKREAGFSLIELMVAMTVFILAIAAASNVFLGLLGQFKQQSSISESNMEGMIGFEILKRDIELAGDGLPWTPVGTFYPECTNPSYNDSSAVAPRSIVSDNDNPSLFNGSDYIVVKGIGVASNNVAQKWTRLGAGGTTRVWGAASEDFSGADYVVVYDPFNHALVTNGGSFSTQYNAVSGFAPTGSLTYIVYGINPSSIQMPFNRADYYISDGSVPYASTTVVPSKCAPGTGVLVKAEVSQAYGILNELPLIDCAADMQVVYGLDSDGTNDGVVDLYMNDISALTAQLIRDQLKEVRLYVLAHEGALDMKYTMSNSSITVGEFGLGRDFDLTTITNGVNYRWRVYTLVVRKDYLTK